MDTVHDTDVHWDMSYRPSSWKAQQPASFPTSSNVEYPSPVTSVSDSYASPHTVQHLDQSAMFSVQADSRAGPERVLTRRQRAAKERAEARPSAPSTPLNPTSNTSEDRRSPSTAPFDCAGPHTASPRSRLSDGLLGPLPAPMQSQYSPTPDSASTSISPQGYYDQNASSNDRSASPALSTVTTASSHSITSNTQTFASFPPAVDARKPKQRKQRLFNLDRRAICEFHRDFPAARQEDIAAKYGVERSTISKILKHKIKWLNIPANEDMRIAKHRPSKFPIIEDDMAIWLADPETRKTPLSDMRLREKARDIAQGYGLTEDRFKASSGWVENFKHRHGIRGGIWTGDGPKSGARKARAMGVGTLDTQTAFMAIMPPGYTESYPMVDLDGNAVEPTAMRLKGSPWDTEKLPSSSSNDGPSPPPPLQHVHHSSEHLSSASPSDMLGEQHQHASQLELLPSPQEHGTHSSLAKVHTSLAREPARPIEYPPSADGLLPTLYHDGTLVYQNPQDEAAAIPTMTEGEDYLNRLLLFFDTPGSEGEGLLTSEQRETLGTIRAMMFNAASGIRPCH